MTEHTHTPHQPLLRPRRRIKTSPYLRKPHITLEEALALRRLAAEQNNNPSPDAA